MVQILRALIHKFKNRKARDLLQRSQRSGLAGTFSGSHTEILYSNLLQLDFWQSSSAGILHGISSEVTLFTGPQHVSGSEILEIREK